MAAYHITNFGSFSNGIPTCQDGFTYTLVREWMEAKVDGIDSYHARQLARESKLKIKEAQKAIKQWRKSN